MVKSLGFEATINSPDAAVAIDFYDARGVLLIAFGGLAGKLGMPVFEFFHLTSKIERVNKIFLRDRHRLWYHAGLSGIGKDVDSIASFLRQYTEDPSTHRVITFGNSGGGYAAMLFGQMLQVNEVHAFSPKTFIDPLMRIQALDLSSWRDPRQPMALWLFHRRQRQYFDLKKWLVDHPAPRTQFHVYYSGKHRVDRLHAARMEAVNNVCLHSYPTEGHDLVRQLKQTGELSRIVERSIGDD
jgi:pimeloyl-ACP methyl ester carboxylesterase